MKESIERLFLKVHGVMLVVVLFIAYFLVVGPTALYARIIRHPKLPVEAFPGGTSWVDVSTKRTDAEDYLRPF
jgi:hypothetical protein